MSDPTGLYEVTLFSEVLESAREHLETGANVVVGVEASLEADQLKLLVRSVKPVENVVADAGGMSLRIFVDRVEAFSPLATLLEQAGEAAQRATPGAVSLCLVDSALPGEVEIDLGRQYKLNPRIKGALKALPGVLDVQEV